MLQSLKIVCPLCNQKTELHILKSLEENDVKNEMPFMRNNTKGMVAPVMTNELYSLLSVIMTNNLPTTIIPTISRIKSHKTGLSKGKCGLSDKKYKVFLYIYMDYEKRLAGFTFRILQE